MLGLLDVFTREAPSWSADALIHAAGISRSTAYRYIRALSAAGLLSAVADGHYVLGPRITELDRQIRQCDPLYNAAGPIMKRLVTATGHLSTRDTSSPLDGTIDYEAAHLRSFSCQPFYFADPTQHFEPAGPSVPCPSK